MQATDYGGKSSQTIVEVTVVPGPNTRSPVFHQSSYQITVSEGAPINSSVATIMVSYNLMYKISSRRFHQVFLSLFLGLSVSLITNTFFNPPIFLPLKTWYVKKKNTF